MYCFLKETVSGILSLLVPVLVLAGCAGHVSYDALSAHLSAGDCNAAARLIEDSRGDYGTHSELLFFLDSAMVHMQCKNFQAAQERFHSAEDLAQQLWTTSLSREAVSLISNDYLISYGGEDYERAMIHLMSAIAYLDAENFEDALVECRRLDSLLTLYNDRYAEKNVYKEDAFGRYLSGILNEADHNLDAAFIDYQKALESYADYEQFYQTPAPSSLKKDFLRVARAVNRVADARNLIPGDVPDSEILYKTSRTMGEILVIQLTGRAPVKVEDRVHIPTIHGPITLAFPKFLPVSSAPPRTSFLLRSRTEQKEIQADLAADITAIAFKNLADHRARIITKTIARAAVKQAVIRQAAKKVAKNENKDTQQAIEIALNLMNLFLEHADLRSWQTLPARVYMARAFVEQGAYELEIPSQVNGRRKIKNIMVTAGKIHYIIETDSPGL